jgi:hypothetical protein
MIAYLQNQPIIYLFRQKVVAYDKATEINLFSEVFFQTAKEQCIEF